MKNWNPSTSQPGSINVLAVQFVPQFVPLDLSAADTASCLHELTSAPEADDQWTNLAAEIAALAVGKGVRKIEGDQQTRTVSFLEHPLVPGCERKVTFCCASGSNEERAEGCCNKKRLVLVLER